MSYLERVSLALLVLVTVVTALIRTTACTGLPGSQQEAPAAAASMGTVIVTADSVNLRQAPDRSASVLARAELGQELELLSTQEDWYNVRWGEGSLWLSKLYASPVEDCSAEQSTVPEALLRRLQGEWKGEVGGRPATFIFYTRNQLLCAYILYLDVKEALAVEASGTDTVTLTGKRYERLSGTNGDFSLDTFNGRLEDTSERLAGRYSDAGNNQGEWYAARPGATSQEAMLTTGEEEARLAEPADTGDQAASPPDQADTQTAPAPVAEQPAAEPEESTVASAPKDETDNRFFGRWEGSGRQFSPRQRWRLEMDITSAAIGTTVGTISYPTLRCGGDLFLRAADESSWTLRETITYGRCITGGSITMTLEGPDRAQWRWHYSQGELGAEGEVRRQPD